MAEPMDPKSDLFRPPDTPTLVGCLHCGQEYESYRIEWRIERTRDGKSSGFWCCPIAGCGGRGFGFDILPLDPAYRDERGGWCSDDDDEEDDYAEIDVTDVIEDEPLPDPDTDDGSKDEELPW
jgi:hypothetical protein